MCFGSSKTQEVPAAPAAQPLPDPTPSPIPAASPTEVQATAEQKRNKIAALKFGAQASVRNVGGAKGIAGTSADLIGTPMATSGDKKVLGA
jgi:hypothetical protein